MTTYHARAERGDKFWLVYVSEVDRWTQATKYGEIESMARDLVAVMDDVEPDSFELQLDVQLPEDAAGFLDAAERAREEAARRNADAAHDVRTGVALLLEHGLSQQEVGEVLGVGKQRVSQLVAEGRAQLSEAEATVAHIHERKSAKKTASAKVSATKKVGSKVKSGAKMSATSKSKAGAR